MDKEPDVCTVRLFTQYRRSHAKRKSITGACDAQGIQRKKLNLNPVNGKNPRRNLSNFLESPAVLRVADNNIAVFWNRVHKNPK